MTAALQLNPAPEFVPMPPPIVDALAVQAEEIETDIANSVKMDLTVNNWYTSGITTTIPYNNITWTTTATVATTANSYYTIGGTPLTAVSTGPAYTYSMGTGASINVTGTGGTGWVTYNTDTAGTYTITNGDIGYGNITWASYPKLTKEEQVKQAVKQMIRKRLTPDEKRHREYLIALKTPQEQRARDSLRDIISETDWRRYVTNGFVMVRGPSGKFYQVFANRSHTQVFEKGKNVASLCIHSDGSCPPTDHVINMKLLIEMDESLVWEGANVTWKDGRNLSDYQQIVVNSGTWGTSPMDYSQGKSNLIELVKAVKSA
jgi:hypothetical protein